MHQNAKVKALSISLRIDFEYDRRFNATERRLPQLTCWKMMITAMSNTTIRLYPLAGRGAVGTPVASFKSNPSSDGICFDMLKWCCLEQWPWFILALLGLQQSLQNIKNKHWIPIVVLEGNWRRGQWEKGLLPQAMETARLRVTSQWPRTLVTVGDHMALGP